MVVYSKTWDAITASFLEGSRLILDVTLAISKRLQNWRARRKKKATETLVELMRSGNDKRVRVAAAQALLERGWAKA